MRPEEHQKFMHSVMSPFDAITKQLTDHSAIEESKYEESELPETSDQQSFLQTNEEVNNETNADNISPPTNEEDTDSNDQNVEDKVSTSPDVSDDCQNCEEPKKLNKKLTNVSKDIDTPEGFQEFADGLLATD